MESIKNLIPILMIGFCFILNSELVVEAQLRNCASRPCKNGAACMDQPYTVYGYSCVCPPPWKGVNCDLNSNSMGNQIIGGSGAFNNQPSNNWQNQNNRPNQYNPNNNNFPFNNNNNPNNNRPGSNVYIGGNNNNPNQFPNNNFGGGGSNVYIGGNNFPNNQPGGANVFIGGNIPPNIPPGGANLFIQKTNTICLANPCLNGGTCQPGLNNYFKCHCRYGFNGVRCETSHNYKGRLLGIILGSILSFFALTIVVALVIFCCCRH